MAKAALQAGIPLANPDTTASALLALLGSDRAGDLIEALLDRMDALDGDPDREGVDGAGITDDDEPDVDDEPDHDGEECDVDCCAAGDDDPRGINFRADDGLPGDPGDAEDGHDEERGLQTIMGGGSQC